MRRALPLLFLLLVAVALSLPLSREARAGAYTFSTEELVDGFMKTVFRSRVPRLELAAPIW